MISPPNYKCEVITHNRNEGEVKLTEALAIIKRVIKANKGTFKQLSDPVVIGTNQNVTDTDILLQNAAMQREDDDDEDQEEDNDEGMGDVNLNEDVAVDDSSDEEEKKD